MSSQLNIIPLSENLRISIPEDVLEGYEFLGLRGRGKHGNIYVLRVKKNNRIVAGKVYKNSEESHNTFIHSRLEYPYIATILNIVTSSLDPKFLMEIFPIYDKNLEELRLTFEETIKLMRQLIIAVDYLHANNVAHRDIHGGNILIANIDDRKNMMIKLTDFNIATKSIFSFLYSLTDNSHIVLTTMFCLERFFYGFDSYRKGMSIYDYVDEASKRLVLQLPKHIVDRIGTLMHSPLKNLKDISNLIDELEYFYIEQKRKAES